MNMTTIKRFLIVVTILTLGLNHVFAERVSLEDAATVASNFMNASANSVTGSQSAKRMVLKKSTAANRPQFYIYENADGEGWVMVAANDIAHPIIAYSDEGHFRTDNQPDNIKYWLGSYEKQIRLAEQNGLEATEDVKNEWKQLRKGVSRAKAAAVISPLIKTGWDQDSPYWNLCPSKNGSRCYTGCVATAMAQVMNYHQWPEKGTGSHSITYNGTTYTANFGTTTYEWANMKNSYSGSSTTAQKTAVATLMYHCGVAVDMSYGTASEGGSGAFTIDYNGYFSGQGKMCAETALTTFFGYKASTVKGYFRDGDSSTGMKKWTESAWIAMLKEELDASRPIMYAGGDSEGETGHSFVCDGYDSDDKFHFNWGWGNYCDGYYNVNSLVPSSTGSGGGNGDYSYDQDVIIGIIPDKKDLPKYDVTWSVKGSTTSVEYTEGDALVLPSAPADCSGSNGKKFVGWTANSSVNGSAPADLFTTAGTKTVTGNITYYAVFATATTSGSGGGSGASVGTTLWSEDFSGYSADDVPSGSTANSHAGTTVYNAGSVSYSCTNGGGTTKVYNANLAGGTSPELLIAKSGGSLGIGNIPTGSATVMTLTFNTNQTSGITVTSNTTGITVGSVSISSNIATCEITNTSAENFDLVITKSTSGNSREDNFLLVVKTAGVGGGSTTYSAYSLTCDPPCANTPTMSFAIEEMTKVTTDAAFTQAVTITGKGSGQTVAYSSSDESIATVNSSGKVTLQGKAGEVTITASVAENGSYCAAEAFYNITVTEPPINVTLYYNGTSATLNNQPNPYTLPTDAPYNTAMCDGDWTFAGWYNGSYPKSTTEPAYINQLTATGSANAVYKTTETSGSSTNGSKTFTFATIASNEGWANGVAQTEVSISPVTITASGGTNDGKYYTSDETWRMYNGGTVSISVASGNVISVTSNPSKTFTINNGIATLACTETVKFTEIAVAYTVSGSSTTYYATAPVCAVPCTNTPTMSFANTSVNKTTSDGSYTQTVSITGKGAGQTVVYSSSDESIATVNASGVVTLKGKIGTTTITASVAEDDTYCAASASYTINVTAAPIDVTLYYNGTSATLTNQTTPHTLPTTGAYVADMCSGDWKFDGWYGSTYSKSTTQPTYITELTSTGSAYAVYAHTETSGGGAGATAGTTMWSENWTGVDNNKTPTSPSSNGSTIYGSANITYSWTNGGSITQTYTSGGPNSNENILVSKSNGAFTAMGIPTGGATELTVTYLTSGSGSITVSSPTANVSVSNGTISISNSGVTEFSLEFKNTTGSNVRLDDILVSVKTAGSGGSSTTYYTTSPDCPTPCTSEITITKGENPEYGTFTISNSGTICIDEGNASTTVTALPDTHYHLATVTSTSGTVGTIEGNTCSITDISANSTINVTFAADPKDVVNWYVNGTATQEEKYAGEALSGITAPTSSDCDGSKKFMGWTATADYSDDVAPADLFSDPSTKTMPAGGTNFYAVFATESTGGSGSASLTKQGSEATFSDGDNIVIVAKGTTYALYQETSGTSYVKNWTFENSVATVGEDTKNYLTLTKTGDEWYLGDDTNDYLYTNGSNNLAMSESKTKWTITWNSTESAFTIVGNSRYLSCRTDLTTDNQNLYRLGGQTSGSPNGTAYFDIYKYVAGSGGGTTYSGYTTSCTPCESQIVLTKGTTSNGTFSLNKADGTYDNCSTGGLVVTVSGIEPADGYQFKEIRQTGIDEGVTIDNDAKTVTYDKDVAGPSTINVIFEPKPSYTIRFYNNESLIGSEQMVVSGKTPIVPSNPEACEGYTFVGWWTMTLAANNTETHTWVSDFTATGDRDYHAVYRHNEGGSGSGNVSFVSSEQGYGNGADATAKTIDGVTFTFGQGDNSSNAPKYYSSGTSVRMYAENTLTISSESSITAIAFTFGGTKTAGLEANVGTYDDAGTWSGEATSVTFTAGSSGQQHIQSISVTVDGGGTNYFTTVFSCSGHMITVESVEHGSGVSDKSRCDEGGTVTITLTADAGYDCGGITTAPDVSVTEASECTYTFSMPDEDITVTPVFTPKTPRTFTFEKGTGICETATLTEAVWNGGVTLPTATANSGCDPEYVFAGWATAAVTTETEVRPTLYAAGTLYNEEETTLYAVYSQTTGGSASGFTLSYTHNEITYYVTARTGTNSYMGASTDETEAARFTIVTSNDKKYLCWHGEHDTYVHNSADNTTLKFTTELASASDWTVTEEGTSITLRNSTSGRYFMFNTNQKDRFSSYAAEGSLTKGDAGTTVYNSIPSCVCYSVDITYNANGGTLAEGCENVTGGECERDWLLCDAPTRDGYLFTNWKDQNGTLYDAGAVVTDLKISLTLTAQWIPAPYTVLFNAGSGSCVESLTESSRGDGIILPKAEPSAACADDWTFIGWSETNLVGETNTSATIIGVAGVAYTPETNNVTLYAVYSTLDEGGATPDYTRVTSATPEEGDYAIVVAQGDESFGLLTYGTTAKGRLEYTKDYTSLPLTTISSPDATQIWHLTYDASGNAYLYNANAGAYLAASGTNISYAANAGSAFVFTKDPGTHGDYECLNSAASTSSNYYLGANKDADYIRYYSSATLVATNSITLYKGSTGTRYYSTSPACTPCTDPEWSFEMGTSVTKTKGSEPFTNRVVKGYESSGTVTYSSTNEAVATVDATGLVTMHETGTTTITLRLTKAMPYCAAVLQYELEVKEPSIDIVGVTIDGEIIIEHDLEGTITLDLSEGNAISTGTAANDLFFSKYFEAASNMKLFAIFNGTGHEMDLSNIRVRCNCTTSGTSVWPSKTGDLGYVELRTISKLREQYPKLKIPSGTELIFWSNNKGSTSGAIARNTELRECIEFEIGDMEYKYSDMEAMEIPNWFCLGDYTTYQVTDADGNNQFVFNGDDSMILERYNPATGQWEAIDLFGAGTSEAPADTEGLVENIDTEYEINGKMQELNDGNGFHAECEGNPIPLSTNRYMLVRKNTVLDGKTAVASNTTSFATLCDEWDGTPVGGTADAYCHSGGVFSDIAEYDYAENYIDWDEITDDKYDVEENEDGTVSVTFTGLQDLAERACSLLKIEVHDKDDDTKILATTEYKIPIVVKEGDVMTTAELFHNQAEKCATCDVAILGSAILTKATDGATNDMPEVRDIYVYGGGKLVIPSGTHYRARDLIMRMQMADDKVNIEVPNVWVDGSLTNQYGGSIRQQVRVGTSRFYQFAVPYPVRLEDVTFSDGTPAVYGEDFMIRFYDGEQRAANQGAASNWRNFEGTQLMPGVGYTLAVAKKAGHEQRELVFPMSDASLNDGEPASKETTIHAWGDNSIRANHRGWNFLSNPYLTTYAENNLNEDAGGMLTTGQLVPDPDHPGWWISDEGTVPYVTLINSARTDYSQELVSLKELPPFTTFFIQAGDDDHSNGEEFSLTFDRAHRKASAPSYIRAAQKTPVARFGVLLSGNGAEDNCGVVVGEKYSAAYDMQADLSKEFGSAYSLKLYSLQEDKMQMAFLATHPDSLRQPIPLGVRLPANGEYTFSIDRRYNLGAFAHIYLTDNLTGQHTDLLDDTYTFTGSRQQNDARFSLSVEMQKETPTDIQHLLNGVYAVGRDGSLLLTGMPETADIYIYDMGGRMVHSGHTQGATSVTYPLPTGVYQIRVLSEGANALLRTIVY